MKKVLKLITLMLIVLACSASITAQSFDLNKLKKVKQILSSRPDSACFMANLLPVEKFGFWDGKMHFEFYQDSIVICFGQYHPTKYWDVMSARIVLNSTDGSIEKIRLSSSGQVMFYWFETWWKNGIREKGSYLNQTGTEVLSGQKLNAEELTIINEAQIVVSLLISGSIDNMPEIENTVIQNYLRLFERRDRFGRDSLGNRLDSIGAWKNSDQNFTSEFKSMTFFRAVHPEDTTGKKYSYFYQLDMNLLEKNYVVRSARYLVQRDTTIIDHEGGSVTVTRKANPNFNPKRDIVIEEIQGSSKEAILKDLLASINSYSKK